MTWSCTSRPRPGRLLALAGGVIGAVLVAALPLGTAASAAAPRASLTLSASAVTGGSPKVDLVARLGRSSVRGAKLAGVKVTFSVEVTEFQGAPPLVLGSATTNASGTARITYEPTWTGAQHLVAAATTAAGSTLATGATTFTARSDVTPLANELQATRPDGGIGKVVVGTLLAIVVILWIVLITVFVRVRRSASA